MRRLLGPWVTNPAVGGPGFIGALDPYTNALSAVWSSNNRLLTSFTGGNLLKARESIGNTEQFIPYLSNGAVDVSKEASFDGAGNLFESQLLGQVAANPNFAQSSASAQPQIATSTGAVSFNGSSQNLIVPNDPAFQPGSGSLTIMVRIKSAGWSSSQCIAMFGGINYGTGTYTFFTRNTNKVSFELYDSGGGYHSIYELAPTLNAWTTLWGWLDVTNSLAGACLDGGADNNVAAAYTIGSMAGSSTIGCGYNAGATAYYWPGSISHVAFWKRKLSQTERAAINTAIAALP